VSSGDNFKAAVYAKRSSYASELFLMNRLDKVKARETEFSHIDSATLIFSSTQNPYKRLVWLRRRCSQLNVDCVRISRSQEMKLYRPTKTPVMRGSAYRLEQNRSLLWTAGYIPELATYPGREVPNPLLVEISRGDGDMTTILRDVMGLTKVNFNACIFSDGLPVTLRFAEAVGEILTAAPHDEAPHCHSAIISDVEFRPSLPTDAIA